MFNLLKSKDDPSWRRLHSTAVKHGVEMIMTDDVTSFQETVVLFVVVLTDWLLVTPLQR